MYDSNKFYDFSSTLYHSWGGDTPQEVAWAAFELLKWFAEMRCTTVEINEDEPLTQEVFEAEAQRIFDFKHPHEI